MALVRVGVRVNEVSFAPEAKSVEAPQAPGDGPVTGWLERIPAFESSSDLLDQRLPPIGRRSRRVADLRRPAGRALRAAGGRAALVHDPLRARHADHLPADAVGRCRTRARRAAPSRRLAGHAGGRLPRRGAGQDHARGQKRRADAARREAAQPLLRHRRRDAAVVDPALGVLALHRRRRSSCAPAGTTFSPRSPGSTGTETATATDTSSTRRARHRASATSAGRTHGTACSSPTERSRTCRSPRPRSRDTSTTRSSASRSSRAGSRSATDSRSASKARPPRSAPASTRTSGSEERGGFYVVGLDGDKRPIDSLTSNIGHLLWSGIVPDERARVVADHLLSDRLFSGWGVRTLSSDDRGYNPIGYHVGTIWPHDNSILALGLARAGFRDEANRIALAQLEAASFTGHRLPEAFAGFERSISRFPVPYPTACSPQAWATGAPLRLHPGDARPRGPRRRAAARPGGAGGDRPHRHPRLARARPATGISRQREARARSSARASRAGAQGAAVSSGCRPR